MPQVDRLVGPEPLAVDVEILERRLDELRRSSPVAIERVALAVDDCEKLLGGVGVLRALLGWQVKDTLSVALDRQVRTAPNLPPVSRFEDVGVVLRVDLTRLVVLAFPLLRVERVTAPFRPITLHRRGHHRASI